MHAVATAGMQSPSVRTHPIPQLLYLNTETATTKAEARRPMRRVSQTMCYGTACHGPAPQLHAPKPRESCPAQ